MTFPFPFVPPSTPAADLLIVLFSQRDTTNGAASWPGGWTQLFAVVNSNIVGEAYYLVDTGVGSTITVTTTAAAQSAHVSLRIKGYTGVPEQANSGAAAASADMDPPSLSPSTGNDAYLFVASAAWNQDNNTNDATAPAGYTALTQQHSANNQASQASGWKQATAASEDPAAWVYTSSRRYVASTISVRGTGGSAPTVNNTTGGVQSSTVTSHTINIPAAL